MHEQKFAFGKNWNDFLTKYMTEKRMAEAEKSLSHFLGAPMLEGKTFLDIGCGSGLFSLAANRLHAKAILSFDADEDSVACTMALRHASVGSSSWRVERGDILDDRYCSQLGKWDVVYSWGVLHHTGHMWLAIDRASELVADDGLLYLAIYNRVDDFSVFQDGRIGTSRFWKKEKRLFSRLPPVLQNMVCFSAACMVVLCYMLTLRNPKKIIDRHINLRGMSWWIDMKDWLGGYPYEYASVEEVFERLHQRGFALERLVQRGGLMNNEFLFRKRKI